jgi:hypothetical protein
LAFAGLDRLAYAGLLTVLHAAFFARVAAAALLLLQALASGMGQGREYTKVNSFEFTIG